MEAKHQWWVHDSTLDRRIAADLAEMVAARPAGSDGSGIARRALAAWVRYRLTQVRPRTHEQRARLRDTFNFLDNIINKEMP